MEENVAESAPAIKPAGRKEPPPHENRGLKRSKNNTLPIVSQNRKLIGRKKTPNSQLKGRDHDCLGNHQEYLFEPAPGLRAGVAGRNFRSGAAGLYRPGPDRGVI